MSGSNARSNATTTTTEQTDVIIVGAGVAGLCAAHALRRQGKRVLLLERFSRVGGRMLQMAIKIADGTRSLEVDVGGEFVHGDRTALSERTQREGLELFPTFDLDVELAAAAGADAAEVGDEHGVDKYKLKGGTLVWSGRTGLMQTLEEAARHSEGFKFVRQLVGEACDASGGGSKPLMSALTDDDTMLSMFGNCKRATLDDVALIDAAICKTWTASVDRMNAKDWLVVEAAWDARNVGIANFRPVGSFARMMRVWHDKAGGDAVTRCFRQVRAIEWQRGGGVRVHATSRAVTGRVAREVYAASACIVCVNAADLGAIEFTPALPPTLAAAVAPASSALRMGGVLKVFLSFARAFWPEHHALVLCPHAFAAQVWFNLDDGGAIAVAYVGGDVYDVVSTYATERLVALFLRQLDGMYEAAASVPNVASSAPLVDSIVHRWERSYTYPATRHTTSHRLALQSAEAAPVFFAGEALDVADAGTIESALRTGEQAAGNVLAWQMKAKL